MDIPHQTKAILPNKNITETIEAVVRCLTQEEVGEVPRCRDLRLMQREGDMTNGVVARDEDILQMAARGEEADQHP